MIMHKALLRSIIATLILVSCGVSAAPRVAVLYSAWGGYAFRGEMDPHLTALGWAFEKFENTRVADLVPRLGEFDLVISAGVGNYENAVDMAAYKDAWLGFLERGGLLLITDASYGQVLNQWVNGLGPDYALSSTECAFHRRDKDDPERMVFAATSPLLHVPTELPPLLAGKTNLWAHLDSWTPAWTSLVTCADGKSLLVTRDVGKGCLLATSYYSFQGAVDTPVLGGLLQNLWLHGQGLRAGVALTALQLGVAVPGEHTLAVGLRNQSGAAATYALSAVITPTGAAPLRLGPVSASAAAGADARLELPYRLATRGDVVFSIELSSGAAAPLVFEQKQSVPPMLSLALGNRHFYPWHKQVPVDLGFAPEAGTSLAQCRAELLMDGRPALSLAALTPQMSAAVELAALTPGVHTVTLRLRQGDTVLGEVEQPITTHPEPRVMIRPEDGTALIAGTPFFPFGWYHVSWSFTAADRLEFLQTVAAGGFNTVHASLKQIDEWDPFLAAAEQLKMKVITEFGVDMQQAITRYRERSPVLAWNPGDEPDGQGVAPRTMLERHNSIKDWDSGVPTFMTLCQPQKYSRYVEAAEVIAPDPYPITSATATTDDVYALLTRAQTEAWKYGRPIWAILQCFGYDGKPGSGPWVVPTFAQVRNMTYLALLAGAKGVLYYTFRDPGFDMAKQPELWAQMTGLPAEIKRLEPWLLDGRRVRLETGFKDVYAGAWTLAGKTVVCVVSSAPGESRDVALALPAGVTGPAVNLFPSRPGGLSVQAAKLSGAVGPLAVQVYEF
jgi:hypothetical protein